METAVNWDVDKPRDQWLFSYPAQARVEDRRRRTRAWFRPSHNAHHRCLTHDGSTHHPKHDGEQVVLTGTQIYWTEEAERALEEYEGGQEDAVKRYLQVLCLWCCVSSALARRLDRGDACGFCTWTDWGVTLHASPRKITSATGLQRPPRRTHPAGARRAEPRGPHQDHFPHHPRRARAGRGTTPARVSVRTAKTNRPTQHTPLSLRRNPLRRSPHVRLTTLARPTPHANHKLQVQKLVDEKTEGPHAFLWQQQLRFYWTPPPPSSNNNNNNSGGAAGGGGFLTQGGAAAPGACVVVLVFWLVCMHACMHA